MIMTVFKIAVFSYFKKIDNEFIISIIIKQAMPGYLKEKKTYRKPIIVNLNLR